MMRPHIGKTCRKLSARNAAAILQAPEVKTRGAIVWEFHRGQLSENYAVAEPSAVGLGGLKGPYATEFIGSKRATYLEFDQIGETPPTRSPPPSPPNLL